jgi:NAD(P)-dependent dehydrogenase (short-subunit alcohol dehydrogenase family)
MRLQGKVALVTGAGSGIGKASALLMAKEGAEVACLGRTQNQIKDTVQEIISGGGKSVALIADIAEPDQMIKAMERFSQTWNRLDILYANAGVNGVWAPLEDLTPEEWDQTMGINARGTFLSVKYALPFLKKKGGSIVVCSSICGTRTFTLPGFTAYACSKAAQVAFAKVAALELAQDGIRVNAICPGYIKTEIGDNTWVRNTDEIRTMGSFPHGSVALTNGEPGTPQQVAKLVLFLASDDSDHITGTEMWIDGGESLII